MRGKSVTVAEVGRSEIVYEDDDVLVIWGNCMDPTVMEHWMRADVLVTDPPYGMSYVSNSSKYNGPSKAIAGDQDPELRDRVLAAWRMTHKDNDGPAMMFGKWNVPRPSGVRQRLIWDKGDSPGMGDLSMPWGPGDEEIYVMGSGWTGPRTTNVLRQRTMSGSDRRRPNHPTPKPIALMEALIANAPEGVIADPFAGSGATVIAARNLGRKVIAVELESDYCEIIFRFLSQPGFVF